MIAILTHHSKAYNSAAWMSLAGAFGVGTLFVRGNDRPIKGFVTDSDEHKKPGEMVAVVIDSTGVVPLEDFVHPKEATYAFGPDDNVEGWSSEMDRYVCINTPGNTQLFSYAAAAIVLWDRQVKLGDH